MSCPGQYALIRAVGGRALPVENACRPPQPSSTKPPDPSGSIATPRTMSQPGQYADAWMDGTEDAPVRNAWRPPHPSVTTPHLVLAVATPRAMSQPRQYGPPTTRGSVAVAPNACRPPQPSSSQPATPGAVGGGGGGGEGGGGGGGGGGGEPAIAYDAGSKTVPCSSVGSTVIELAPTETLRKWNAPPAGGAGALHVWPPPAIAYASKLLHDPIEPRGAPPPPVT